MTTAAEEGRATGGAHLVGSVPIGTADRVFRAVAARLGDRVRRIPDGETGPRSHWIVWQYPVLSSRPEFEVCPPDDDAYRSLPRLRLRDAAPAAGLHFEDLGYAQAAISSYQTFARLKRDGVIPVDCRFQVSLPTPLSPVCAFIAPEDQVAVERAYEARLLEELEEIERAIPHDQLAVQWDANFEFAMLQGTVPAWFTDVRAGIVERLLRLARHVATDVELGFHFCQGHELLGPGGAVDLATFVEIANAVSSALGRSLTWLHLPVGGDVAPLRELRLQPETELYLGLVDLDDNEAAARASVAAASDVVQDFGVATLCGWGRCRPEQVEGLLDLHAALSSPISRRRADAVAFGWPDGFVRLPAEAWVDAPVDDFGLAYDSVEGHGWYRNLDPTVEQLSQLLGDGDVLVDYSGGTGILLDRLRLRLFGAGVGVVIVDSSKKFLRVAVEKYRNDHRVGFRLLHYMAEHERLERLDEVLGEPLLARGVDVIVSTNAIHLYPELAGTLSGWVGALRPGGRVLVNSGNIRNPRARRNEWILDETVWVVSELAEGIVRTAPELEAYRPTLDDPDRMAAHAAHRDRVFLEPRPLEFYVDAFEKSGLEVEDVGEKTIEAHVDDWYDFLSAYHEAVLGWVGGTERIDGEPPSAAAVADRLELMRRAIEMLFAGRRTFHACWTFVTCRKPGY